MKILVHVNGMIRQQFQILKPKQYNVGGKQWSFIGTI